MIHELFPEQFGGIEKKIPEHKAAAVSRADHIIAISQNTRTDIINFLGVPERKISVIPLASSLEVTLLPDPGTTVSWDKPYLLYVGLRQGVKNFSTLLTAYMHSKTLRHYDLLCVGGGPFTSHESGSIKYSGLQDKIHQIEADDIALKILYANATVFVYPSLYEGFGLPLLEAMKCGCPVVCSNTSSMPEIAGDAACYFDPADAEELRFRLERMVLSETEQKYYQQRGYEREKIFSWDRCVEQTVQVYKSLQ
jgi:glycosyltransferase involved in cell wall biosynthesis